MYFKAANFIAFQIGWLACVLGAANGWPWLGVGLAIPIVAWHLWQAQSMRIEFIMLVTITTAGGMLDQGLLSLGLVSYPDGPALPILPVWMWTLWILFATTLNVSLRWLRNHVLAGSLLGLAGGPLAYWAANRLGAIELVFGPLTLSAISVVWALVVPAMIRLSTRLDGFAGLDGPDTDLSHV